MSSFISLPFKLSFFITSPLNTPRSFFFDHKPDFSSFGMLVLQFLILNFLQCDSNEWSITHRHRNSERDVSFNISHSLLGTRCSLSNPCNDFPFMKWNFLQKPKLIKKKHIKFIYWTYYEWVMCWIKSLVCSKETFSLIEGFKNVNIMCKKAL